MKGIGGVYRNGLHVNYSDTDLQKYDEQTAKKSKSRITDTRIKVSVSIDFLENIL